MRIIEPIGEDVTGEDQTDGTATQKNYNHGYDSSIRLANNFKTIARGAEN